MFSPREKDSHTDTQGVFCFFWGITALWEPNRGDKQWLTYVRLGAQKEEQAEIEKAGRGVMAIHVHIHYTL